jgi:hypothetical protein
MKNGGDFPICENEESAPTPTLPGARYGPS